MRFEPTKYTLKNVGNGREFEDKGWTLKNIGTGKYLKDASSPAKYDEPTYFTFCTLKEKDASGITTPDASIQSHDVYTLQGVKVGKKEDWNSLPRGIYIVDGKLRMKQ